MKKLLFTILSAVALFSSCSSDNDTLLDNGTDNIQNEKKYTVNLNIKSAGFEIDKTPLKSAGWNSFSFLQIIVYKESGEVYSDSVIDPTALKLLLADAQSPQISLSLPKGNYFLSVLERSMTGSSRDKIEDFKIMPNNYETDYFVRKLNGYSGNENIYYYTNSLNVEATTTNSNAVTLEPMWSYIQEPNLKFAADFVLPAGADIIYRQISPIYYGFGIKSKLAKTPYDGLFKEFGHYDTGYVREQFPRVVSKAEDSNLFLDICYIKTNDGYSGGRVLKIQKIKLPVEIENGMNYKISGTVPAVDSIDTGILNIGLEPFKDSNASFQ